MTVIEMINEAVIATKDEEYAGKKKTSFWASETEVMAFDIYHRWKGTPPTHPMSEEKMMMLKMRKLTEEAIVQYLRRSGKVIDHLTNAERVYFEWGPHKVPVSGYPDLGLLLQEGVGEIGVKLDPVIVEVKTYYGGMQHSKVRIGQVKTAHLKQLAIYMWHFKIPHGVLLMVNQGTGEMFEFHLYQATDENLPHEINPRRAFNKEYTYTCPDADLMIDLEEVFQRFERIYVENVLKEVEPAPEFIYKYDITKINWDDVSADAIRKARSGNSVIGDWQCKYSDFKGLIAERQGTSLGYTPDEIERIKKDTAGYSAKKSGKVKFDPTQLK